MPPDKPPRTDPGKKAQSPTSLSAEDRVLWENVAGSIQPLEEHLRSGKRDHDPAPGPHSAAPPKKRKVVAPANFIPVRQDEPASPVTPEPIDRRAQRKIARGRTAIDSTLDLHGMTQEQAFTRLRSHIEEASRAGQRCILVITGKGTGQNIGQGTGSGVLRRNLPDWLANRALSGLVSGIAPAGSAHGGGGAFYVRLRKQP